MVRLLAFLLLMAAPAAASAHDFRVERDGDGFVLRYGHVGHEPLPVDRAKIRALRCAGEGGAVRDVLPEARFEAMAVRRPAAGSCAAVAAFHDGGYYCLTPDGEKPLPKRRCPEAVKSWESRQFAKWIDVRSPVAARPVGDEFELVPVTGLAEVRRGDKATFRVLHEGKPVAGAVIAIGHKSLGETDSRGEARVKIRGKQTETISATLRRPAKTEDADAVVLEASLTFAVTK